MDSDNFSKDCPMYEYVPTILPATKRIIAIGDIHGDYDLAIRAFITAKLIDKHFNWVADPPSTVVVQVGDQVDSCRSSNCHNKKQPWDTQDDIKVITFFDDMHKKAKKVGGAVYSLLGNHELMNVDSDFRYVSYTNYHEFEHEEYKGPLGRKEIFKQGGKMATHLACSRNSVLIIGSNMFVHAGILPELADKLTNINIDINSKLKYINKIIRDWLLNKVIPEKDKKNLNMLLYNQQLSPFWTRVFGHTNGRNTLCTEYVEKTVDFYKIGQIIVGHTPQTLEDKKIINSSCKISKNNVSLDRLYRIDGGFSKGFALWNGHPLLEILEIINDNEFNILHEKDIITHTR